MLLGVYRGVESRGREVSLGILRGAGDCWPPWPHRSVHPAAVCEGFCGLTVTLCDPSAVRRRPREPPRAPSAPGAFPITMHSPLASRKRESFHLFPSLAKSLLIVKN